MCIRDSAITHMLLDAGVKGTNIQTVDRIGTIYSGRGAMDMYKEELSTRINPKKLSLSLSEAVEGADILIGASRKSMIGRITNTKVSERLPGSISLAIASIEKGVKFLRVHDIKETKQALTLWNKINYS